MQLVALAEPHVSVTDCPPVIEVADAVNEAVGCAGALAVIALQAPQLLFSFDSTTDPAELAELLSAHARTYQTCADGNVYENDAVADPFAASAAIVMVPISVALAPAAEVPR